MHAKLLQSCPTLCDPVGSPYLILLNVEKVKMVVLIIRNYFVKQILGTSLVLQWLRIHLPTQGDTGSIPCLGRSHMPRSHKAHVPQLPKPKHCRARDLQQEKPPQREDRALSSLCSPQVEKTCEQQWRFSTTKNKYRKLKILKSVYKSLR